MARSFAPPALTALRLRTLAELERASSSQAAGEAGSSYLANLQRLTSARDLSTIADASDDVGFLVRRRARSLFFRPVDLEEVEDNRLWNPQPWKRPRAATVRSTPARIVAGKTRFIQPSGKRAWRSRALVAAGIQFRAPTHTIICIRRKRRRAAILASGKGGGSHKRARRNSTSNIWC